MYTRFFLRILLLLHFDNFSLTISWLYARCFWWATLNACLHYPKKEKRNERNGENKCYSYEVVKFLILSFFCFVMTGWRCIFLCIYSGTVMVIFCNNKWYHQCENSAPRRMKMRETFGNIFESEKLEQSILAYCAYALVFAISSLPS